jgi:hypothetical protein
VLAANLHSRKPCLLLLPRRRILHQNEGAFGDRAHAEIVRFFEVSSRQTPGCRGAS